MLFLDWSCPPDSPGPKENNVLPCDHPRPRGDHDLPGPQGVRKSAAETRHQTQLYYKPSGGIRKAGRSRRHVETRSEQV